MSINQTDNLTTFCKIWGLLKYHHPVVAKGKYDWDKMFIEHVHKVQDLKSKKALNDFYFKWISGLGELKKNSAVAPPSNAIFSNYDNNWITDTTIFSDKTSKLLLQVINNSSRKNHYVKRKYFGLSSASYVNENLYKDSSFPSAEMRLLVLSRYWNIVNYFYPYKYLTDTKWSDILNEFIPQFISAKNADDYHLSLLALFAKLNDSHTGFNFPLFEVQYKMVPFNNKIMENKIIVLDAFNDSICKKYDIQYGDAILKINGEDVKSRIGYFSKYVSTSNYASLCEQLAPQIIWQGLKFPVTITYERNGIIAEKEIPEYPLNQLYKNVQDQRQQLAAKNQTKKFEIIGNNIGYINLKNLTSKSDAKKALENIKSTQAVIIDIRNYPNSSIFAPITNFFCREKKPFAKFAKQSIAYPGVLINAKTVYCGRNTGEKYKGKVIVLINESTISFAEYFAMALKTIPNIVFIGNHTAGADGSNNRFVLPGNIQTSFSNEAVYYPNGDQTQRIGILPDIKVMPTIEGVRLRKDEVLVKAIEILR